MCICRFSFEGKRASKFEPNYFELNINGNGYSAPLSTEFEVDENHSAIMTGYADRVDLCRNGDTTYVKIYDYKTGSHVFKRSKLENGLDMQMIIYLLALTRMKDSEFKSRVLQLTEKIEPAGIVYLTYKVNKTDVKWEADFTDSQIEQNEKSSIEQKITRSGLEINAPELLSSEKSFNLSSKSQIPLEEFDSIFQQVKATIASIGLEMLSGAAYAEPLEGESPCKYCKNGAVCRKRVQDNGY